MNHQSDFGYSTSAVSMRCIACGSIELACCDGKGNPLNRLDKASHHLASMMLNQVGVEWDDACDSVDGLVARMRKLGLDDEKIASKLYYESYRYEDM